MNGKIDCAQCISTKQMKESCYCTQTIVKHDSSFVPECFIKSKNVSQSERNYLICPTYNLGMYEVCNTCPLECIKNPSQQTKSPIGDIINLLGGLFGVDDAKKNEINQAFKRLNQPEFKEIYSSLERSSRSIKDIMSGKIGSSDVAKKVLEVELGLLKNSFNDLIKDGKITHDEVRIINAEINSEKNMQKLKSMIDTFKYKNHEKIKI